VEVFSESSEGEDRGHKFREYRSLPSLENYVLIAQDRPLVEIWYRAPGQELWRIDTYEGYEVRFTLQAIETELNLAEVYATVRGLLEKSPNNSNT
jgi:Uma2 family endonuclease